MMLRVAAGFFVIAGLSAAADIQGTVVIERRLTHYSVTASAGIYQRGTAVPLGADPQEDPISYERSHVAIYVEGPSHGPNAASTSTAGQASIEQQDRRFVPDLVVIPAGSSVSFPNFDPIFHNVFSLSKAKSFDLGNYPKGQTRMVTFPTAGIVEVYCHLHPNMAASIVIAPNQWYTLANPDGEFTLKHLPPGSYNVVAWHKTAGTFRKTVQIGDQGVVPLEFLIPYVDPPVGKHVAHR